MSPVHDMMRTEATHDGNMMCVIQWDNVSFLQVECILGQTVTCADAC